MTAKTFKFQSASRYYRRRSAHVLPCAIGVAEDGTTILSAPRPGMVTRWGWQRNRYRRPHDAYLVDGFWCEVQNVPTEFGEDGTPCRYEHAWQLIGSRKLEDRHRKQSAEQGIPAVTLVISDGEIISARTPEGEELTDAYQPDELARALKIN